LTHPGYLSCHFFFLPISTQQVWPAPKPLWSNHFLGSHPNCTPHPNANSSFKLTYSSSAPHSLLSPTNKIWLANDPDDKFGTTSTTQQQHPFNGLHNNLLFHLSLAYNQHLSASIATTLTRNQYHATIHVSPTLVPSRLPHMVCIDPLIFALPNSAPNNFFSLLSRFIPFIPDSQQHNLIK
jgi:hypothetical protein